MTYNPKRARHPVTVAQLNDANSLRGLVTCLERNIDGMTTQPARRAAMDSITVLNATIKALTP